MPSPKKTDPFPELSQAQAAVSAPKEPAATLEISTPETTGAAAQSDLPWFEVRVKDGPTAQVQAPDAANAELAYRKQTGLRATPHAYEVTPIAGPSPKPVKRKVSRAKAPAAAPAPAAPKPAS